MEMRGLMGGLYRISEWVMRLSVINVLWIIVSLPFFLLLLGIWTATDVEALKGVLFLTSLSMPLFFFPGTSAMFSVARKWVMGDTDVPLLKTFFRSYKQNFVQSLLGGIVFVVASYILYVDYQFYIAQSSGRGVLGIVFITFLLLYGAALFNFFSLLAHLHMSFFQLLKNTLLVTVGVPLHSLSLIVSNGVVLWLSGKFTFLIPFFVGTLIAYNSFFQFYRLFTRMQEKREKWQESEQASEAAEDARGDGADAKTDAGEDGEPKPDKPDKTPDETAGAERR